MCGIAGVITHEHGQLDRHTIQKMSQLLHHRGPDDQGYCFWDARRSTTEQSNESHNLNPNQIVLIHRRLSILDTSAQGRQPMLSSDLRYQLVFNGEIYNYLELREQLEKLGHRFRSSGDTAVLLAAIAEWKEAALSRLVGMFGLAALDTQNQSLLLARDFAGIKPLYLTRWSGGLAFASEMRPLLQLPGVRSLLNLQKYYDYLRAGLVDHDTGTLFADINQIPAGHYLHLSLNDSSLWEKWPEPVRFWNRPESLRKSDLSFRQASKELRSRFLATAQLHLRSDVPLGVGLSGGIDSSAIATSTRYLLGRKSEIHAFSYVADQESLCEEVWIDRAGRAARATVHKVRAEGERFWDEMEHLISTQEQPFGSASVYAQYCVMRTARENGIKVLLSGQGADEVFAGYRSYLVQRTQALLARESWWRTLWLIWCTRKNPSDTRFGLINYLHRATYRKKPSNLFLKVYARVKKYIPDVEIDTSPNRPWFDSAWFRANLENTKLVPESTGDVFKDRLWHTFSVTSLPHLLRYEDRNSMAHSVESRVPFLTPSLVEFVFSLPEEYLLSGSGVSKSVLRHALKGILPRSIRRRTDKIGFETPDFQYLKLHPERVRQMLSSTTAQSLPGFDSQAALQEWEQALSQPQTYQRHIWRWVNLIRWVELFNVELPTTELSKAV